MTLNEYQRSAMRTASKIEDPEKELAYCGLAIAGEAGEVADVIKKALFHGVGLTSEMRNKLILEGGDTLWGLARLCSALGITLEEMAQANIEKLHKRYPGGFDPEVAKQRAEPSTAKFQDLCPHPKQAGQHSVYLGPHGSYCRACGAWAKHPA